MCLEKVPPIPDESKTKAVNGKTYFLFNFDQFLSPNTKHITD